MDETRKRARTGNEGVASAPAAKAPHSPQSADAASAATNKIAELQAELEALKESHSVAVNELNAKVDALQAKNESLTSALQWAYADEEIPRQHWLEVGYNEEYADEMENFRDCMKQSIKDLMMGTVSDSKFGENMIKIEFNLEGEDENYIRADHDESLMPYWKELASAIRHWSEYHADGKCLQVGIQCIELPKTVLDTLRPAFERSRIELVYLGDSRHTGDLIVFIKKVLQSNQFITKLGFVRFMFTQEDVKTICGVIKSRNAEAHPIENLVLWNCFEGMNTCTAEMILTSISSGSAKEVSLYLSNNGMSSLEAVAIAGFLRSNPSLAHLEIDGNRFGDADAAILANSLSVNTHLRSVLVENNGMKENGRLAFLRAVFDVSSLSSCAASNHTCCVHGLERDISVLNSCKSSSVNKWGKIVVMLALSGEDSFINTALLRGVPAQLIPMILDKVVDDGCADNDHELTNMYLELTNATRCQKHSVWDSLGERKSLNCMYNLMRSWVVPSIFV